jgi:hypothetical protein
MTTYPKIIEAKAKSPYVIEVLFDNQITKIYDFEPLLTDANFRILNEFNVFKNFSISAGGYGLEWNEDLDISESELWVNGVTVK